VGELLTRGKGGGVGLGLWCGERRVFLGVVRWEWCPCLGMRGGPRMSARIFMGFQCFSFLRSLHFFSLPKIAISIAIKASRLSSS